MSWCFEVIGMYWEIEIVDLLGDEVKKWVIVEIDCFDCEWLWFCVDFLVCVLGCDGGCIVFCDVGLMFDVYWEFFGVIVGVVNFFVVDSLVVFGYDVVYLFVLGVFVVVLDVWEEWVFWMSGEVMVFVLVFFDVGVFGKGCFVDFVVGVLIDVFGDFVVDVGGDICVCGVGVCIVFEYFYDL